MTTYLISYDLMDKDKNYDGVAEAIKSCSTGVWCRPLASVFLIESYLSAQEISNAIKAKVDADDKWLVIEVKNNKYGVLKRDMWEYMNKNMFI
ncbi:hypothetical protein [Paenisporosarcina cavernae]|uniref:CRISPR-associated protein Cas2 n=1 Tax=Paenisporosarcina cavernae TaxID=2320858 RepID=A0A385YT38_9BACL|nr:hypothetical protein [Paenisporosarcina cavernae]AYC29671.1 hypothetical protein D3873_07120 [Paenisporosarcina cavernae]AYC30034.1 hypothetical protein D3873_09170 [Paenisporosarcina cavernae]